MSFFQFLDALENTLDSIEVKGKENVERLLGCLNAIDDMRNSLYRSMEQEVAKKTEPVNGGDEVGRQSDIGADTSNVSNGE